MGAPGVAPAGVMGVACIDPGVARYSGTAPGVVVLFARPAGLGALVPNPAGDCAAFGAGVEGGLICTLLDDGGFDFTLVTKNENFAPELLGNHSMKLYVGK